MNHEGNLVREENLEQATDHNREENAEQEQTTTDANAGKENKSLFSKANGLLEKGGQKASGFLSKGSNLLERGKELVGKDGDLLEKGKKGASKLADKGGKLIEKGSQKAGSISIKANAIVEKGNKTANIIIDKSNEEFDKAEKKYICKVRTMKRVVTFFMVLNILLFLIIASVCSLMIVRTIQEVETQCAPATP